MKYGQNTSVRLSVRPSVRVLVVVVHLYIRPSVYCQSIHPCSCPLQNVRQLLSVRSSIR